MKVAHAASSYPADNRGLLCCGWLGENRIATCSLRSKNGPDITEILLHESVMSRHRGRANSAGLGWVPDSNQVVCAGGADGSTAELETRPIFDSGVS